MVKIVKIQIPGKIYWNGFTRQIKELYYLLFYENYISCSIEEFLKHFTGKKITNLGKPTGRIKFENDWSLLSLVLQHLYEKGFFDETVSAAILKQHFSAVNKNTKNTVSKLFKAKLEMLFPAPSGYRCKERLFYKARNKMPQIVVLEKCGIEPNF